jgi:type I site-specific restriction endonuclease
VNDVLNNPSRELTQQVFKRTLARNMPITGNEAEWQTRKKRIDTRLRSHNPQWQIIPWQDGLDVSKLTCHAVTEFPTENGPADYALFVNGILLGNIEAKKVTLNPQNVLEQAKRYSRGAANGSGNWNGFHVPFLYATNGQAHSVPTLPRLRRPTRPPKSSRRTGKACVRGHPQNPEVCGL